MEIATRFLDRGAVSVTPTRTLTQARSSENRKKIPTRERLYVRSKGSRARITRAWAGKCALWLSSTHRASMSSATVEKIGADRGNCDRVRADSDHASGKMAAKDRGASQRPSTLVRLWASQGGASSEQDEDEARAFASPWQGQQRASRRPATHTQPFRPTRRTWQWEVTCTLVTRG